MLIFIIIYLFNNSINCLSKHSITGNANYLEIMSSDKSVSHLINMKVKMHP